MNKMCPTTVLKALDIKQQQQQQKNSDFQELETNSCPYIVSHTKVYCLESFQASMHGRRTQEQESNGLPGRRWSWSWGPRQLEFAGQMTEDKRATQSQNSRYLQSIPLNIQQSTDQEMQVRKLPNEEGTTSQKWEGTGPPIVAYFYQTKKLHNSWGIELST